MCRTPRLALALLPLLLATSTSHAQVQHRMVPFGASPPATPPATGPLASALEAARATDYPRAESELRAITGKDKPEAQLALARILYEQGRFADADQTAQHTGGSKDLQLRALALRAQVLSLQGKKDEAVKLLLPEKDAHGAGGRAVRLYLGEYRIATGHRQDADAPLKAIIDDYNNDLITSTDAEGLAMAGRAAYLLRSPKDANTLLNKSERVDKSLVDGLVWHAELFLDTYDPGHAEETLNQAVKIAPQSAEIAILLARVKLEQTLDFDAADQLIKNALATNPHLPSAYAVRASIALRDGDLDLAAAAVSAGLHEDPNNTELWTLRAAERFLADDRPGYEAAKKETLARNPEFAKFYTIVGDFAEWEHRYSDIIAMMKEAVALDPDDGKAYAELGLTEMRDGDEQGGLDALRKAWAKDHFNVRVYNTLNLYEQTIANSYDLSQENVFAIRYPKDEEKVLMRYVPRMLGEAWGSMKGRYDFVPETPVQVELYAGREAFSVRTSGLPNIGIEGVCFGHVLASMSPKSEPFNWGNVLWHELGHVFAIQLSKSRVPRWFTEGLSEYETIVRRPEWRRELDPELYQALTAGRLPGAVQMNHAFTHATSGEDMTVAYYASSQMMVFTAETFGMPKIVQALRLWGDGKRTPEVIRTAFGLEASEYDSRYRAWQKERLARFDGQYYVDDRPLSPDAAKAKAEAAPKDAKLRAGYGLSLLHEHKVDDAKAALEQALKLDPKEPTALYLTARLALASKEGKDPTVAATKLALMIADHHDGYPVQLALAEVAEANKDKGGIRRALEGAARFDPSQPEPLKGLFQLADEEKREDDAIDILGRWAMLEQHDRKIWKTWLHRLVEKQRWAEASRVGESALFVDVESGPLHVDYARALSELGQHAKAAFELESATLCNGPPKARAAANVLLAKERLALHDTAGAKAAREAALRLDHESAEAKALDIP